MNDLVSYIFRNMDATDKHLIRIYKALVHQNKFNKGCITLFSVVTTLNLLAMRADSKKMQQEIAALRKEIDELNESEGV